MGFTLDMAFCDMCRYLTEPLPHVCFFRPPGVLKFQGFLQICLVFFLQKVVADCSGRLGRKRSDVMVVKRGTGQWIMEVSAADTASWTPDSKAGFVWRTAIVAESAATVLMLPRTAIATLQVEIPEVPPPLIPHLSFRANTIMMSEVQLAKTLSILRDQNLLSEYWTNRQVQLDMWTAEASRNAELDLLRSKHMLRMLHAQG